MARQTELIFSYGISREQACILCHLSSECGGCCAKCMASNGKGSCNGQLCSLPSRDQDGQRWDSWMWLVKTQDQIKQYARKVIPANLQKKYGIDKLIKTTRQ